MNTRVMLEIDELKKAYGGVLALDGVSFNIHQNEIFSLIGPNGAGKTTLFDCLTARHQPDSGTIRFRNEFLAGLKTYQITARGMARTFQGVRLFPEMSVLENVMVGFHVRVSAGVLKSLVRPRSVIEEDKQVASKAMTLLEFVGLDQYSEYFGGDLSYGDQRRLEIARALASDPTLLLLDEPAAGMNPSETKSLMDLVMRIRDHGTTILLIEHDMKLVMGISDRVVVLDHGKKIAEGPPRVVQNHPGVIEAYLGRGW